MEKILVVDDDEELVATLKELLSREEYEVIPAYSGDEALNKFRHNQDILAALVDLVMPVMDGLTLTENLKEINPNLDVIIISAYGDVPRVVEAIQRGAKDYITKPFDKEILLNKLGNIKKTHVLQSKVDELQKMVSEKFGFENIVSRSPLMKSVFERANAAALSDATVLIVGETGTGKDLISKAIHLKSDRKNYPYLPINCGSIPPELLESELFGHKKGAFTGAIRDHEGVFSAARNGTVFLDEIGEMQKDLQVRILRVLEEGKIRPVGETREIPVNCRIITATNRSIDELKNKYLREDLFFRLAVIIIEIPPLRKRKEDIPVLVEYFLKNFNKKYDRNIESLSKKALEELLNYSFPGNVRELENVIEGIFAITSKGKTQITEKDLRSQILWRSKTSSDNKIYNLENLEKFALKEALRESNGNKSRAAKLLGISRDTLYRKLKDHAIS